MFNNQLDEISLGILGMNDSGSSFNGEYALFHNVYNSGGDSSEYSERIHVGKSREFVKGYLACVTAGKNKDEVFIHNGVSSDTRIGHYPGAEFLNLDPKDLEEIVQGLSQRFNLEPVEERFLL